MNSFTKGFTKRAEEHGLSPKQANQLINWLAFRNADLMSKLHGASNLPFQPFDNSNGPSTALDEGLYGASRLGALGAIGGGLYSAHQGPKGALKGALNGGLLGATTGGLLGGGLGYVSGANSYPYNIELINNKNGI